MRKSFEDKKYIPLMQLKNDKKLEFKKTTRLSRTRQLALLNAFIFLSSANKCFIIALIIHIKLKTHVETSVLSKQLSHERGCPHLQKQWDFLFTILISDFRIKLLPVYFTPFCRFYSFSSPLWETIPNLSINVTIFETKWFGSTQFCCS